jgi:hypothetical protein
MVRGIVMVGYISVLLYILTLGVTPIPLYKAILPYTIDNT